MGTFRRLNEPSAERHVAASADMDQLARLKIFCGWERETSAGCTVALQVPETSVIYNGTGQN
jgi:hypothetical protein